jgi:hypothetical protein
MNGVDATVTAGPCTHSAGVSIDYTRAVGDAQVSTPRAIRASKCLWTRWATAAAAAEDSEFDVLVIGGIRHVGAGEQDVSVVDDDGLGVELGIGRLALIGWPVVDAVLRVGSSAASTVQVLRRFEDEIDSNAAGGCRGERCRDRRHLVSGVADESHPLVRARDELSDNLRGQPHRRNRRVRTGDDNVDARGSGEPFRRLSAVSNANAMDGPSVPGDCGPFRVERIDSISVTGWHDLTYGSGRRQPST